MQGGLKNSVGPVLLALSCRCTLLGHFSDSWLVSTCALRRLGLHRVWRWSRTNSQGSGASVGKGQRMGEPWGVEGGLVLPPLR